MKPSIMKTQGGKSSVDQGTQKEKVEGTNNIPKILFRKLESLTSERSN